MKPFDNPYTKTAALKSSISAWDKNWKVLCDNLDF